MTRFKVVKYWNYNGTSCNPGDILEIEHDSAYGIINNGLQVSIPLSHLEYADKVSETKSPVQISFKDFFGQDVQSITFK